jgi:hypothetical protein
MESQPTTTTTTKETDLVEQYIATLSEKDLQAYQIAKTLLGMSFQMDKSNGYLKWKQNIK